MGRPRKIPANVPEHVRRDYHKIPQGLYWSTTGNGRWYVLEPNAEGGTRKRKVAQRNAKLSDLHAIAEARNGGASRGTVDYVGEQFAKSLVYRQLSKATRDDYDHCANIVRARPIGRLQVDKLSVANVQKLVDAIAQGKDESRPGAGDAIPAFPSKANHVRRYLSRVFSWGVQRGHCTTNPAKGVAGAKEKRQAKVPTPTVMATVLAFARERGALPAHSKGSCPPYLAPAGELAYGVRLRGIEVSTLSDAHGLTEGIQSNRRKGSLDNVTRWTPRLRAAWDEATRIRERIWAKKKRPVPMRAEDRPLFVDQSGGPLSRRALKQGWQALMHLAIEAGVITVEQRFTLHGLKHRGVTDTHGTRAEKKDASGHRTEAAFNIYDHALPVVNAAGEKLNNQPGPGESLT